MSDHDHNENETFTHESTGSSRISASGEGSTHPVTTDREVVTEDSESRSGYQVDGGKENRDPVTGAPGSHPIGLGTGGIAGSVAASAAVGAVAGPAGALAGAVVGAVIGAAAGKAGAEAVNPTEMAGEGHASDGKHAPGEDAVFPADETVDAQHFDRHEH